MSNRVLTISLFVFLSSLLLSASSVARECAYPVRGIKTLNDLKKIAHLNESDIDIGCIALILEKERNPDLDVEKYNKLLDIMVLDIQNKIAYFGDNAVTDHRVRIINTYFFRAQKFQFDKEDPYAVKPSNRTLSGVMDTRNGSCWTLPLLYLSVAQRLHYPIYPVSAPQHIFLRYILPDKTYYNIEATNGGTGPDEEIIYTLEIPERGIRSGAYMRTMTYREFLGEMIAENARYWLQKGSSEQNQEKQTKYFNKALGHFKLALKLEPNGAEIYHSTAMTCYTLHKRYKGIVSFLYFLDAQNYYTLMEVNGVAGRIKENYWVRQKERQNEFYQRGGNQ